MTWNAFRNRGEILRDVIEYADGQIDDQLPMHLPGVAERFADELDLLSALLLKWHARLSGNIERALMEQPMDLEAAVAQAWSDTAAQLPGVRRVLDRYTQTPTDLAMGEALRHAQEREWQRLAVAAGLASDLDSTAISAGRRVTDLARRSVDPVTSGDASVAPRVPAQQVAARRVETVRHRAGASDAGGLTLVERIRAVLAA